MAGTLGSFFLIAALVCAVSAFLSNAASLKITSTVLSNNARRLNIGAIAFVILAFAALIYALFDRDYSLQYVYEHSANSSSGLFTFTASWAGLEGSLLLWTVVLCGYLTYVLISTRTKKSDRSEIVYDHKEVIAHMVMGSFIFFFLLMLLLAASPFEEAMQYASNGLGANPLLQDHYAMAIHPPMLYIGYVGFVVPFAYVIASLIRNDYSTIYSLRVRRTSMIAWVFLTAGIILGAWWSYEVLGWGGYWSWDPVENASFLPWLTATAYLHSAILQSKRNMLRGWNYTMVIATCALTILGTFLTRSGIVNSVHSFTQSHIGAWLLTLFAIVVIGGTGILVWRSEDVKSEKSIKGASKKETMFLLNNIVFCLFALIVLLGTTYPLIADAFRNEQISVGTPYYEKFSIPIGFSILLLMGIAPMVAFADTKAVINERIRVPALFGVIALCISVLLGQHILTSAAVGATIFVVVGSVIILYKIVKQSGKRALLERPRKIGAMIVHIGIATIGLAIVLSSHTWTGEVTLEKNETKRVGPYELTYLSFTKKSSEDVIQSSVDIKVVRNGKLLGTYAPRVRTYPSRNMSVGTPSVHSSALRDTYLTLTSTPSEDEINIKIAQNPAVIYIWVSGVIIVIGSVITLLPQKRGVKNEQ